MIELEYGFTVYPAREGRDRWRAVWYENGERGQCEAVSRSEFAGMPGCQGVVAKCSASSAATWSAACSGSQCEAPSSSVKR